MARIQKCRFPTTRRNFSGGGAPATPSVSENRPTYQIIAAQHCQKSGRGLTLRIRPKASREKMSHSSSRLAFEKTTRQICRFPTTHSPGFFRGNHSTPTHSSPEIPHLADYRCPNCANRGGGARPSRRDIKCSGKWAILGCG